MPGILGNLAKRGLDRLADDVDTARLVVIDALHAFEHLGRIEKCRTATGNDAFFDGCAGCVQRIVDAVLAFLDFDFRSTTDLDDRNAAGELGKTLLELFLVIVAGGVLDLLADRFGAALDRIAVTQTVDDRGVVLVDLDRALRSRASQA